jgi:hypothetical protein
MKKCIRSMVTHTLHWYAYEILVDRLNSGGGGYLQFRTEPRITPHVAATVFCASPQLSDRTGAAPGTGIRPRHCECQTLCIHNYKVSLRGSGSGVLFHRTERMNIFSTRSLEPGSTSTASSISILSPQKLLCAQCISKIQQLT